MPLTSIVVIVVRLFALNWLLHALVLIASATAIPLPSKYVGSAIVIHYGPAVLLIIFAVLLWILASLLARLVSRGFDATVSVGTLSRLDLYSFAFVFLGLFFVLSSFADVINWIHYFATDPRHDSRDNNLYQITRPCLTLAAGLVSLLGARRWTRKLAADDQKNLEA